MVKPQQRRWIQKAVAPKNVGAFTAYAKTHGGMAHAVTVGLKSKNPTTRRRAQFAKNMRTIAQKHKGR